MACSVHTVIRSLLSWHDVERSLLLNDPKGVVDVESCLHCHNDRGRAFESLLPEFERYEQVFRSMVGSIALPLIRLPR